MPFDAGFAAAVVHELKNSVVGAKTEKIHQPERDEIILVTKIGRETKKILISAKAGSARIGLTSLEKENPQSPPMFCMLLRKHLSGSVISDIKQLGFERAVEFQFDSYDELGFPTKKYIILETTGRYNNIIFCDGEKKVVSALRLSEISSLAYEENRKLLCGFRYEPMPLPSGRISPISVTKEEFISKIVKYIDENTGELPCDKYLVSSYCGISPLVAREIAYRTAKDTGVLLSRLYEEKLLDNLFINFSAVYSGVEAGNFSPCLIKDKNGSVVEYSFCEILQYETKCAVVKYDSASALLDKFFGERDLRDRIKQKSQDILKLLTNASSRINKKAELQRADLAECDGKDKFKKYGDLIISNMYMLKKGMTEVSLIDYSDENMPEVKLELEINLTPSQNAQKYYKKYNKMKSAQEYLKKQLESCAQELAYIDTVFESLTKAQNEKDLEEIREELRSGGYGKKLDSLSYSNSYTKRAAKQKIKKTYSPMTFRTSGGWEVLCGKNNLQNDYITMIKASKNDYWFHVKNMSGSHTVMLCGDSEPDALDFTECAMIAAYYSSGRKIPNVAVDYTKIRNIKKPTGAKPGFVVYETNYSAYVTADEERVLSMKTN